MDTQRQAVVYARVSSSAQEGELKVSLDTQLDGIYRYCQERCYQIVGNETYKGRTAYTDVFSGKALDRRGLLAALDSVPSGGVLVVYDVDRLAREDAAFTLVVDMLFEAGAGLEAVLGGDLQTPAGKLLLGFKRVMSQAENDQRIERAMRAKREHAKRGFFISGKLPFGYDYVPKQAWKPGESNLVINPAQAETAKRVFDLYTTGHSLREISSILNSEHVATPANAQEWARASLLYILRNPAYMGQATFDLRSSTSRYGKVKVKYNDTWTSIACPAIVDQITFDKVQQLLDINRARKRAHPKRFYMLSGLLLCAECGCAYSGNWNVTKGIYAHKRRKHGCINISVSAKKIERQIWEFVVIKLRDSETIREALGATDQTIEANHEKRINLLNKYQRQLSDLAQERVNLARLASKGTIGEIDYAHALAELERDIQDAEEKHEHIRRELASTPSPAEVAEFENRIGALLAILDETQVELTREEKRAVLLELDLVFVRMHDGRLFAKGRYSGQHQGVLLDTLKTSFAQRHPAFWIEVPQLNTRGIK